MTCQHCKNIKEGVRLPLEHEYLIPVKHIGTEDRPHLILYTCKHCFNFVECDHQYMSMDKVMNSDETVQDGLLEEIAAALIAEERKAIYNERIQFLKSHTTPIYHPLLSEKHFDKDFGFADHSDYYLSIKDGPYPRYFFSYVIPAEQTEPILRLDGKDFTHVQMLIKDFNHADKMMIYDALEMTFHKASEENFEKFSGVKMPKDEVNKKKMDMLKPLMKIPETFIRVPF